MFRTHSQKAFTNVYACLKEELTKSFYCNLYLIMVLLCDVIVRMNVFE